MKATFREQLPHLDAKQLHRLADQWNWDDGYEELHAIIAQRQCSLATALMLYWRGQPHYYRKFSHRDQIPFYNLGPYELLKEIEERLRAGVFQHHGIAYDPRQDQGHDFTRCKYKVSSLKSTLPDYVFVMTTQDSVIPFESTRDMEGQ